MRAVFVSAPAIGRGFSKHAFNIFIFCFCLFHVCFPLPAPSPVILSTTFVAPFFFAPAPACRPAPPSPFRPVASPTLPSRAPPLLPASPSLSHLAPLHRASPVPCPPLGPACSALVPDPWPQVLGHL